VDQHSPYPAYKGRPG
jgi:hypothetical protein